MRGRQWWWRQVVRGCCGVLLALAGSVLAGSVLAGSVLAESPDEVLAESPDEAGAESPEKAAAESPEKAEAESPEKAVAESPEKAEPAGRSLFDGQQLGQWEPSQFGGEGDVYVDQGAIVLEFGSSMTGVTYAGEVPRENFELQLEAQREDGTDFFCGLTFPVGSDYCSLILGGWGGAVVGLSSIDGRDASRNDTTQYIGFQRATWYRIRVRVGAERIEAFLDDRQIINQPRSGHIFSTRPEVDRSKPLGIASWETRARIRTLRLRSWD